jgi:hypothetical protein
MIRHNISTIQRNELIMISHCCESKLQATDTVYLLHVICGGTQCHFFVTITHYNHIDNRDKGYVSLEGVRH